MRSITLASVGGALALAATLLIAPQAHAVYEVDPRLGNPQCDWLILSSARVTADRDNTGTGVETYTVRIVDGVGTPLHEAPASMNIGTQARIVPLILGFSGTPLANPITLQYVSHAGNGFLQEETFRIEGNCATVPSAARVTPASFTTDINDPFSGDLSAYAEEPNGFPLTYTAAIPPVLGRVIVNDDGTFDYTPGNVGIDTFTVGVTNEAGQVVELLVTVIVTGTAVLPPETDAPSITPSPVLREGNELAATGDDSLPGLAIMGIAGGLLGLAVMRSRRRA